MGIMWKKDHEIPAPTVYFFHPEAGAAFGREKETEKKSSLM